MGRGKFNTEKKIAIIKAYKAGEVTYSRLREVYGMNPNEIYRWISKYEIHGEAAFQRGEGNARYSKEFKLHCVKEYLSGEGSLDNIIAKYNISAKWVLQQWIMRYNANKELKDYDPKREVYMAEARRKTTLEDGRGHRKADDEVDELERLRRENQRLKRQLEEKDKAVSLLKKVKEYEGM